MLWGDYQRASEALAEQLTSDPARLERFVPSDPSGAPGAREKAFLETLGGKAFRRPLTPEEVTARRALFQRGTAIYPALDPFVAGVRVSIAGFLQSPFFLYRAELSDETATGARRRGARAAQRRSVNDLVRSELRTLLSRRDLSKADRIRLDLLAARWVRR